LKQGTASKNQTRPTSHDETRRRSKETAPHHTHPPKTAKNRPETAPQARTTSCEEARQTPPETPDEGQMMTCKIYGLLCRLYDELQNLWISKFMVSEKHNLWPAIPNLKCL